MVRRVIHFVYREIRGLHQAAYILALFALGSQLLALVRDRLLANEFGAGAVLDIYYAAFRVPDVLFVLFASMLSVYVLIPFVSSAQAKSKASAQNLLSQIFTLFLVTYSALALVCIIAAPWLAATLFPGIPEQPELVSLMRILLLQPLLLGVSSLCGVITQLGHRFLLYAISPLVYNIGIIFGIAVLYPLIGLSGLVLGVVLGALGHLVVQIPFVQKSDLSFKLITSFDWKIVKSVLAVSIPRSVTLSLSQIVLLVLVGMASLMASGSVAVFQFAYNLQSVPLAIIGASYSVAAFPRLAELHTAKDPTRFVALIKTALRHIIFWSVPIIVLCVVLRAQVVRVILGTGAFNWEDTRLTAAVFAIMVVSLVAQAVNLLLIRAFYAVGDTRTPLYVTGFSSSITVLLASVLMSAYESSDAIQWVITTSLRVNDVFGAEVVLLAISYTIGMLIQSMGLLAFSSEIVRTSFADLIKPLRNAVIAALLGGLGAYTTLQFLVDGVQTETFVGIFIQGLLAGIVGIVGVILGYVACESVELEEVRSSLERKIFKTDVVAPQEDII